MKNKNHIISFLPVIVLLLFCTSKTQAQSHSFRNYQVESGLSNNSVYSSMQDTNGFMWFGTKDGLNRFDGYHFKLFTAKEEAHSLFPNLINCLLSDKNNILWVAGQTGLYTFDAQKEALVRFNDSLVEINAMQFDKQGNLWFISRYTLCRYDFDKKTLQTFPPAKYFEATSICLSKEGDIWIGTMKGLLERFDAATSSFKSFNIFSHSPASASYRIQKIYPAGKNSIYVGTSSQGLKQFDVVSSDYKDLLTFNPDKTTVYIRDIKQFADNEFWFATESGIFILNTDSQTFINLKKKYLDPYSLSDNAVYTLCRDKEGGMWAGTYFGGINYYSKQNSVFKKYFPDNSNASISGTDVREICEDQFNNLWIGTEDAGLNKLNPKTGSITQFKPTGKTNSIAYSNIHGLMAVGNELWIGTFEQGLDIMDLKTEKIKAHYTAGSGNKELKSNFILSLLHTSTGDKFIGTGNSMFRYNELKNDFDAVEEVPKQLFISCMLEDHEKTIWVGTHDAGVFYFNPITKKRGHFENDIFNKNSLSTNTVNAIYEDGKQNLWFATEGGGLCKLDSERKNFSSLTIKNGLPSNFVFKVLEDEKKNLWVSTSRGLANLNPVSGDIIVYTKENGLLSDQFNYNSGYKDADGRFYFGSVKGMISFRPDEIIRTVIDPPIYITGFQVQNKELEISMDSSYLKKSIIYTDEIVLPHDKSSFSIDFAALSYNSPEMTSYSYFMKGLDKEWNIVNPNRKINFTNLAPGKYVFKLKAAIDGNWSKKEKVLTIQILPPFWATTWAFVLYAIIIFGVSYFLLSRYHLSTKNNKEKEIYEAKIDFFTNIAHEIRTPLTLIKGPVENLLERVDEFTEIKEDVVTMERNTNRLIALITQILDFRQTETKGFSMDFNKINISEMLNESFVNFLPLAKKKELNYTIYLPADDLYAFADEDALQKIFSNLLNNAIKYAHKKVSLRLLPLQDDALSFTIETENDGLIIPPEMKDKIFEPFYRLKETIKKQGTGLGLALAKSLAELHNGKLYLKDAEPGINVFVLCLPFKQDRKTNGKLKKIIF